MDTVELEALPFGMCPDCLDRMLKGREYLTIGLFDGARMLHAYCLHREAGAFMILRADRPQRWTIVTPIDATEWELSLRVRALAYAGARAAHEEAAPPTAH